MCDVSGEVLHLFESFFGLVEPVGEFGVGTVSLVLDVGGRGGSLEGFDVIGGGL